MAHKARVEFEGAVYHALGRGDRREVIFGDDADRERLLLTPGEVCGLAGWRVPPPSRAMKVPPHPCVPKPSGSGTREGQRALPSIRSIQCAYGRLPWHESNSRKRKVLEMVLAGTHNIRFDELCRLAEAFGCRLERVSGSHHIDEHPQSDRPLNLQNVGGKAKAYQVRQLLRDIEEFHLTMND